MSYYKDFREYLARSRPTACCAACPLPHRQRHRADAARAAAVPGPAVGAAYGLPLRGRHRRDGRVYPGPVAVGVLGANREVYAKALGCAPDEITERWAEVHENYIEPQLVDDGPVMEEIHVGRRPAGARRHPRVPASDLDARLRPGAVLHLAVLGDEGPGDRRQRNVGTYRVMVKAPGRAGMMAHQSQHIGLHLQSRRASAVSTLQAAIILGCTPAVGLCSVAKVPVRRRRVRRRRRHRR